MIRHFCRRFILTSLFCIGLTVGAKTKLCNMFLNDVDLSTQALLNPTQQLISYLNHLWNGQILDRKALQSLIDRIQNQKTKQINFTKSADSIHYQNIEAYLQEPGINKQEVALWAKGILHEDKQTRQRKEQSEAMTKKIFAEMELHRVSKGEFIMGTDEVDYYGNRQKKVLVKLTHNFEAMSTPVTQWMWVQEMSENPSAFSDGENSVAMNINGKVIQLQPDHPVESITWYSAAMFANYMSRKYGLKEVYDFSKVQFKPGTRLENGTLALKFRSPKFKINGPNIYETEGFRLPTEAEQEFLMRDRGRSTTDYFSGVTKENLADYAWIDKKVETSEAHTNPVKEKRPLIIDGKDFYDLHGNVAEWANDKFAEELIGGVNPDHGISKNEEPQNGDWTRYVQRGGAWSSSKESARSFYRDNGLADIRLSIIGFRLVRTVK